MWANISTSNATLILLVVTVLFGCKAERRDPVAAPPQLSSAAEQPNVLTGPVDEAELIRILQEQTPSRMSVRLNEVKQRGNTDGGLQLLKSVWQRDESVHQGLFWPSIRDPLVQLDIADILVQAFANGEIESEPSGAHAFVLDIAQTSAPRVRAKALVSLSLFERAPDVPVLENAAHDERTFRAAVIGLSRMCLPEANAALDRVLVSSSGENVEFLKRTRSNMEEYKQRDGVCPRR